MALQSLPQLLYSNVFSASQPPPPTSLFVSNRSLLFVEFVSLYRNSKRSRRRIGALSLRGFTAKQRSSIKSVLDVESINSASEDAPSASYLNPKDQYMFNFIYDGD